MPSLVDRRRFLKTAAGAAALTLPNLTCAAGSGMFVTMRNLNGFWVAGTPPWNVKWREFVSVASRAGYAGVDTLPYASMATDGPDKVRAGLPSQPRRTGRGRIQDSPQPSG